MSTPHHPEDPAGESTGDAAATTPSDAGPAVPPAGGADDLDAQFLAIVSGIAPSMQWHSVVDEPRADSSTVRGSSTGPPTDSTLPADVLPQDADLAGDVPDRPVPPSPATPTALPVSRPRTEPDTADERSRRREARRQERAEELAAFHAEKAERERAYAEDDAHYEPPPPPPLPRPRGRTVAAVLAIAAGVLLLARPTLLELNQEVSIVLAVLIILGGLGVLVAGLHRPAADGSDGWDDGARL